MSGLLARMWKRVQDWVTSNADHLVMTFVPDKESPAAEPYDSYVRLWLCELFLADDRHWGTDLYPAVHAGVRLDFAGSSGQVFAAFERPPENWSSNGPKENYALTSLLPYSGGTVEIEAGLYEVRGTNTLAIALDVIGQFTDMLAPPLSTALNIADKISSGIDKVLESSGEQPLLAMHQTLVSAGGGQSNVVRPGYLIVVNAPAAALPANLSVQDNQLYGGDGADRKRVTGVDYMLLRVETRETIDAYRLPEFETLRAKAIDALREDATKSDSIRKEAVARAFNCLDLTDRDRRRVIAWINESVQSAKDAGLGAVGAKDLPIEELAKKHPKTVGEDNRLAAFSLDDLLAGAT